MTPAYLLALLSGFVVLALLGRNNSAVQRSGASDLSDKNQNQIRIFTVPVQVFKEICLTAHSRK